MTKIPVTVKFGPVQSATIEVDYGSTVGQLLANQSVRSIFGISESTQCRALINRVEMCAHNTVAANDVVVFETVGNTKGN